MAFMIVLNELT